MISLLVGGNLETEFYFLN